MSNTDYRYRVECRDHFWSCHTLKEAERIKQEFQKFVTEELMIIPIEIISEPIMNEEKGLE
jgi:hypothetical protein